MEAVRTFLQTYDTNYNLMAISNQTLAKLLAGKFKTFEELEDHQEKHIHSKKSYFLFKEIKKKHKLNDNYIIETIFINN
ncbi:hypothetical protein [Tenacibaculum maritimum]|uniref:hypothetical protein n=1 Tax=Tenacibaculum maritimum TaxID=107401 RepID=UPI001E56F31D|nr:hypothetical protein [Tenacibaculum maritimum]MCD9611694.1 hypothetical protein [Tenacibaculum maritimum]